VRLFCLLARRFRTECGVARLNLVVFEIELQALSSGKVATAGLNGLRDEPMTREEDERSATCSAIGMVCANWSRIMYCSECPT
jgi:hypothetical protein